MRNEDFSVLVTLRRLVRFLLIYGLLVSGLLWLLPAAGTFLEARYDALDSAARFALITLLLLIAIGWQLLHNRSEVRDRRLRSARAEEPRGPTNR